ncbi:MAG: DUF3788 family protein, partial [Thermoanaerobaculia bacterium]
KLATLLGASHPLWSSLMRALGDRVEPVWKPSKQLPCGWMLLLKQRDRTLVYLKPRDGAFNAAIVFGDRAVAMLEPSGIPATVVAQFEFARRYAEGRSIELAINSQHDIQLLLQLIEIKIASGKPVRISRGRSEKR